MAAITGDQWKLAFEAVKKQFDLSDILPEQRESIKAFFDGKDVFVNLPTGFGKSLIFQCLPIVADIVHSKPRGSSVVVVISPLRSLMEDQVLYLNNMGIPAIAITNVEDPETIQQVLNGNFIVVFGSPECLLSTHTWRGIFKCQSFTEMLVGVAIDEAHCITQWGLPGAKKVPFRKWYGCLGELRSLIPRECQIMVLTATATKVTKQQILNTLHLSSTEIRFVEQSPDRPNLFYVAHYLDKSEPMETAFASLVQEVKSMGTKTPRTLIYCQTRKQCAVIFHVFEVYLGKQMYHESISTRNRVIEMYHAGTPASVKEHISQAMATDDGQIRVLICTVAFGMGVNCRSVRRVIHFGPSKSVELYIQESGRAGRDSLPSTCVLLYNGLLSANCDNDMKQYVQIEQCRRKWLMEHFGCQSNHVNYNTHNCCDICASRCTCESEDCGVFWRPCQDGDQLPELKSSASDGQRNAITRTVTKQQKEHLREKLVEYHQDMIKQVEFQKMVTCPNYLLEFNAFHINQVVENCHKLFTIEDILGAVEIWRHQYAKAVLQLLSEVFGDIDKELTCHEHEDTSPDETIASVWGLVRDDSALLSMLDSQDLEDINSFMDSCDESANSVTLMRENDD